MDYSLDSQGRPLCFDYDHMGTPMRRFPTRALWYCAKCWKVLPDTNVQLSRSRWGI